MVKQAKRRRRHDKDTVQSSHELMSHPATTAMLARMSHFKKPPIKWRQQADGSWLECYLLPDGTYGNCDPVSKELVPESIRGA
jgi:hypothetical protein